MNNIKIRKKPFLFGNIPIVVAGEHYNIKYNSYKIGEATLNINGKIYLLEI